MRLGEALSRDVLHLHTFNEIKDSLQNVGLNIDHTEAFLPTKEPPESKLLILIQGRKYGKS